jgi:hypothetical protein
MQINRHVLRRLRVPGGVGAHLKLPTSDGKRYADLAARATREIDEQGFTSIPDLLSASELNEAERLLHGLFERFTELSSSPGAYREWAFDSVDVAMSSGRIEQPEILNATKIEPRLRGTAVFEKLCLLAAELGLNRFCFDHAMLKAPSGAARTPWHQDAHYVEPQYRNRPVKHPGLRFWIPFQDATEANGCMEYVPGSHRDGLMPHESYRRGGAQQGWKAKLPANRSGVACPVPAGGIAIHTPLTIHGAGVNASDKPRLAWILSFDRIGLAEAARQGLLARLGKP